MFKLEVEVDSNNVDAYRALQDLVDHFVDELRTEDPSLVAKMKTVYNPNR